MKLNENKCKLILELYGKDKTGLTKLAVEVLLAKDEEVVDLPGMINIFDMDDSAESNEKIDDLAKEVGRIRKMFKIEDEA